ncbi:GIY-YIG nuclease family protein [Clostridium sp.]|uniref:GIY-YIG nuclease family protein n=1 Tax=Clostridium sp. TaxID=1506 RepID=UPI003217486B
MYGIYSITNLVTGDKYIGQTRVSFENRWNQHKRDLGLNSHHSEHLQRAWNKYGEEGFEFKAIHICDELDILDDLEIYYIKKYDSFNNGYNLTTGGGASEYEMSEETRVKLIDSLKKVGRDKSDYTEHQILNVKKMLFENELPVKRISKLTGVRESVIYNVKTLKSWVDIGSEMNDKIIKNDYIQKRNEDMKNDLENNGMTFEEIARKYNLTLVNVRSILVTRSNVTKNKNNEDLKLQLKLMEAYNNGVRTYNEMTKVTGISKYTAERVLNPLGVSLRVLKSRKTKEKNINWDESSRRYMIRMMLNKKQIVIGKAKELDEAIDIREKAKCFIDNDEIEELDKFIDSLKGEVIPKKTIKLINKETKEEFIVEGIGEASRKFGIPKNALEKTLRGKQKSVQGFEAEYVS